MSKYVLTREGYKIPKNKLPKKIENKIKKDLTVTPSTNDEYGAEVQSFQVFKEDEQFYYLPRYYGIENFGEPTYEIDTSVSNVNFKFFGKLRSIQQKIVDIALPKIKEHGGGILNLPCGAGKTLLAIYLSHLLGLKTLILVHKGFLQDQWYERITQFTDAKVGIIRRKKIDVIGKDIVIGMLQSISLIDYDPAIFKDYGLCIIDECFPGYTKIITDQGLISIAKLYMWWRRKEEKIPLIKSFNEDTKKFEFKKLICASKKHTEKLVQISIQGKKIDCTPNHKFLTINGYKKAIKLKKDDILLGINGDNLEQNVFGRGLNADQLQIVLGSFLGDGHINSTSCGSSRLTIKHRIEQKDYCEWKAKMFNAKTTYVSKNDVTQRSAIYFRTEAFDFKDSFLNTSCEGSICPQWIIDKLDFRGIAIWMMDDGGITTKSSRYNISTCSFAYNTQKKLVHKLCSLGINCYFDTCKKGYYIRISKQGSRELISKIYPYIHESMKYKITTSRFSQFLDINKKFDKYQWDDKFLETGTTKITKVEKIVVSKSNRIVYDIEVENNHNFIVCGDDEGTCSGLIVHNCQHFGSRVFSRAFNKFGAKYTVGLSATPKRKDGLTKVIKWYVGDIIAKMERKCDKNICVKVFEYEALDKLFMEKKKWFKGKLKPDIIKMVTNMYKMPKRNQFIANIIEVIRKQEDRKVLILSGRIEHLKQLKKLVDQNIQKDINEGIDDCKTAFYIGKMKDYELKDSVEADIIFATYSMAEEGLDIDKLNTLVLATPKKDIVQSVGRILRKQLQKDDVCPLIIDIIDDFSVFTRWGNDRMKYYNKMKYTLDTYKALDDAVITLRRYLEIKGLVKKDDVDSDINKIYLINRYGEAHYELEKDLDFEGIDKKLFIYTSNLNQVLETEDPLIENENDKDDTFIIINI